jgi:glycosyltransferase involved in cell wall biosynthesis
MPGAVPKREVPVWLDAADLAVALISGPEILWKNATQNKFFDALAAGKPILSNFRGWQSTVVEEAGAGAIFDADEAERGARQLVRLMHDGDWLERAGRAARALASNRFDRADHARVLENVLQAAVDEFRSSGGSWVVHDKVG